MAVYMSTLANGGTRVTPHLLREIDDGGGWKPAPHVELGRVEAAGTSSHGAG